MAQPKPRAKKPDSLLRTLLGTGRQSGEGNKRWNRKECGSPDVKRETLRGLEFKSWEPQQVEVMRNQKLSVKIKVTCIDNLLCAHSTHRAEQYTDYLFFFFIFFFQNLCALALLLVPLEEIESRVGKYHKLPVALLALQFITITPMLFPMLTTHY